MAPAENEGDSTQPGKKGDEEKQGSLQKGDERPPEKDAPPTAVRPTRLHASPAASVRRADSRSITTERGAKKPGAISRASAASREDLSLR